MNNSWSRAMFDLVEESLVEAVVDPWPPGAFTKPGRLLVETHSVSFRGATHLASPAGYFDIEMKPGILHYRMLLRIAVAGSAYQRCYWPNMRGEFGLYSSFELEFHCRPHLGDGGVTVAREFDASPDFFSTYARQCLAELWQYHRSKPVSKAINQLEIETYWSSNRR